MIEHVYRRAAAASLVDAVVVATDDERIAAVVRAFGGVALMTSPEHRTGTDRVAEVAADLACDIVVNVQGDEPLIEPEMIQAVIEPLAADPGLPMSTVCRPITDPADCDNPNVVKVVTDLNGNALYFSRAAVPWKNPVLPASPFPLSSVFLKHIGLYGYRRSFVLQFARLAQTPLEIAESLEQLRALEHGFRIRTVRTQYDSIGVDTPEDLEHVRRQLAVATRA